MSREGTNETIAMQSCSLPSLTSHGSRGTIPTSLSHAGSDVSFARISSSTVLARMLQERDQLRTKMDQDREMSQLTMQLAREEKARAWRTKMARSPYSVNHLAESQRIMEEARVKQALLSSPLCRVHVDTLS